MLTFLHGGPGLSEYLAEFFSQLATPDRQAQFYQQSPRAALDSLIWQLDSVLTRAEQASGPSVLIGHSWGGTLAVEYLRQRQAQGLSLRVHKLVLMSAPLHSDFEKDVDLAQSVLGPKPTTEQIFMSPRELERPDYVQKVQKILASADSASFEMLGPYLSSFDLRDFVKNLEIPVHLIFGSHDYRVPSQVLARYARMSPRFRHTVIEDGGHFPFLFDFHRDQVWQAMTSTSTVPSLF